MEKPTYHDMPDGMYPVHFFHPQFENLGHWFPAKDAWLLDILAERKRGGHFLEIGSFAGCTASILAKHCHVLYCVDTWTGSGADDPITIAYKEHDVFETFQTNTEPFQQKIAFHRRTYPDSLPAWLGDEEFDLIFLDGSHEYQDVLHDIHVAEQHLAPNGILCGHDFTYFEGVTKAVLDAGCVEHACGTIWWKEIT